VPYYCPGDFRSVCNAMADGGYSTIMVEQSAACGGTSDTTHLEYEGASRSFGEAFRIKESGEIKVITHPPITGSNMKCDIKEPGGAVVQTKTASGITGSETIKLESQLFSNGSKLFKFSCNFITASIVRARLEAFLVWIDESTKAEITEVQGKLVCKLDKTLSAPLDFESRCSIWSLGDNTPAAMKGCEIEVPTGDHVYQCLYTLGPNQCIVPSTVSHTYSVSVVASSANISIEMLMNFYFYLSFISFCLFCMAY